MIPLFIVCIIIKDTMICNFTAWNITILLKYCRYCGINGCFCSICYWYECEYQYRKLVSVFTFVILTGLLHTSNKRSCFTAHAHLCSFYVDVRKAIVAVSALLNSHFDPWALFVFFKSLHFWLFFFFFLQMGVVDSPPRVFNSPYSQATSLEYNPPYRMSEKVCKLTPL